MPCACGDNWPIDSFLIDTDKGLSSITLCSPPFDPVNFPVFHYDPHTSELMVMAAVGREVGGLMDCIVSLRGSICEAHETPSFGSSTAPPPGLVRHPLLFFANPQKSSWHLKWTRQPFPWPLEIESMFPPHCSLFKVLSLFRHIVITQRVIFDWFGSVTSVSGTVKKKKKSWKKKKKKEQNLLKHK